MEQERRTNYTAIDLIRGARRDNNSKRPYLLVNPLQGKHVPVRPADALELFASLTEQVEETVRDTEGDILIVAFAETATAIGAAVACGLDEALGGERKVFLMQTTREEKEGALYLYFSEVHSHAAAQKLVMDGMEAALRHTQSIIFVEDEVTTGNTIRNLMKVMEEAFDLSGKQVVIASLLNGMEARVEEEFNKNQIGLVYLVKSDNQMYADSLSDFRYDGLQRKAEPAPLDSDVIELPGRVDMRCVCDAALYRRAVKEIAQEIKRLLPGGQRLLVLGTEEFMYPALLAGSRLEDTWDEVKSHATTRSPILASREEAYPLKQRLELVSLYDGERTTYLYNLEAYDKVVVVTDGDGQGPGAAALIGALKEAGNEDITMVRWCDRKGVMAL